MKWFGSMLVLLALGYVSCKTTEFSGDGSASYRGGSNPNPNPNPNPYPGYSPTPTSTLPPGVTPTPTPTGGLPDDSGVIAPQTCTGSNGKLISTTGQCPVGMAVYAADDGDMPYVACCPLPAGDILQGTVVTRQNQCAANEVIVGVNGGQNEGPFNVVCQPVNPKYTLTPVGICYVGTGWGSSGSTKCGLPAGTNQMLVGSNMGSDYCTGNPFGALFTKLSGDDCKDMGAAQLRLNGVLVPMFQ